MRRFPCGRGILYVIAPILLVVAVLLWPARVAWAHADLQQAEPAVGAATPAPPTALRLRFTEPLDRSATRIEVYDERGTRVDRGDFEVGPPNDRVATVDLDNLGEGIYTVRWWSLSQVDGHRWQGVYRFGVGRTPPPSDEAAAPLPSLAELLVQWTALVVTSLVVGILTFRAWALEPVVSAHPTARLAVERLARALRWSLVLLAVASVGELIATLGLLASEPSVLPELGGLGKASSLALLRLALAPMIGYLAAPNGSPGMAITFAGLLVLTRGQVGHSAVGGLLPILLTSTHQLVAAIWVGGAAAFAVAVPPLGRSAPPAARLVAGRFARLAFAAAGLAVVSGVVNAWVLGLDPARLLETRYGQSLIVKTVLVVLLLVVAAVVWRRRTYLRLSRVLVAELALGGAVLLTAGALARLPPPGETSGLPLELALPAGRDDELRVNLTLDKVRVGDVRALIRVTTADRSVGIGRVRLQSTELAPLGATAGTPPAPMEAFGEERDGGSHEATFAPFARPGWWRLTVAADVHLRGPIEAHFDVLVPDPNRAGVDPPPTAPDAERQFGAALDRLEQLRAVRQRDSLADGAGGLIRSTAAYVAPDRFHLVTAEGDESIAVGAVQAFRRLDEPWRSARRTAPFRYPTYRDTYEGATSQRLGHETTVDGVPARVLVFFVPRDRAWYCWWIGRDDGLLRREVMIAPSHYMTSVLDEFDTPAPVEIPE